MKPSYKNYSDKFLPEIEKAMFSAFQKFMPAEYEEQNEIIRYHFNWGKKGPQAKILGKRIRPMLLTLAAEVLGESEQATIPAAVAVEFIHNFSLIHDDIEDHDEFRHGKATIWKKWGIEKAINAGDALFSLAFRCVSDLNSDAENIQKLLEILSTTCARLTGGQNLDLSFEKSDLVSIEDYLLMIAGKTGSLFSACAEIGAILGGGTKQEIKRFANFGMNLGLAFQIRDDWLGLWGDPEQTGKSKANDLVTGKKTFPLLYAMNKDKHILREIKTGVNIENLLKVLTKIEECGASEYTLDYQRHLFQQAQNELKDFDPELQPIQVLNNLIDGLWIE